MSCNFICWIQAALSCTRNVLPKQDARLPALHELPRACVARRQMLRLILDLLQGPTLEVLFKNASKVKSEKSKLQKSRMELTKMRS